MPIPICRVTSSAAERSFSQKAPGKRVIAAFVLTVLTLAWIGVDRLGAATTVDRRRLERIEDLSESLANQLHRLSTFLLERELDSLATHFSEDLRATSIPKTAAPVGAIKWIRDEPALPLRTGLDKAEFVREWSSFLDRFSSMEDVRFKVKEAHFEAVAGGDSERARARIFFFVVGRSEEGHRVWLQAKAKIEAVADDNEVWRIDLFQIKELHLSSASVDLFSEISSPAGVYHSVPRFGQPGNQMFVAHGVAVADVDRDGLLDVFTTGVGRNFLYINSGDGTFRELAAETAVEITPTATAPLFLDYDNDGDTDLFLAATGFQMLFENRLVPDGTLEFFDISIEAGIDHAAQGFSAVAGDVNADGLPDIYVASYNRYGVIMPDSWARATNGTPNLLFVNQGDGRFQERGAAWGVADGRWSYAAQFGDLNDDGRADLYVANDFGENGLFLNQGNRFVDAASERKLLDPGNGMGVSMGDFDNDGRLDLHITNMSSTAGRRILERLFPQQLDQPSDTQVLFKLAAGNTLFKNLGGGQFADVSQEVGGLGAGWAFGGGFIDVDNDGWEDLHAPNGFISGKSLKDT